ncbi:hypothetical protein BsWGS_16432 [Bradybaena similaris]
MAQDSSKKPQQLDLYEKFPELYRAIAGDRPKPDDGTADEARASDERATLESIEKHMGQTSEAKLDAMALGLVEHMKLLLQAMEARINTRLDKLEQKTEARFTTLETKIKALEPKTKP